MNSDRLRTQILFENIVSRYCATAWDDCTKGQIKSAELGRVDVALMETALQKDSLDFYYKGILSLYEGIISVDEKKFSWATIKLYYSIYYFLRTTLCINGIAFVRKTRDGYTFRNQENEKPTPLGKPDHHAAIELNKTYFSATDFLQSNSINGSNVYEWYRHNRENVNYKYRTFFEPEILPFWDSISQDCNNESLDYWIKKYLTEDIYCFLEDNGALAIPIKRLSITHADLITKLPTGIIIQSSKEAHLNSLITKHPYLKNFKLYHRR